MEATAEKEPEAGPSDSREFERKGGSAAAHTLFFYRYTACGTCEGKD